MAKQLHSKVSDTVPEYVPRGTHSKFVSKMQKYISSICKTGGNILFHPSVYWSNNPIDLYGEKPKNCTSALWENTLLNTSPDSTKDWRSENAS